MKKIDSKDKKLSVPSVKSLAKKRRKPHKSERKQFNQQVNQDINGVNS